MLAQFKMVDVAVNLKAVRDKIIAASNKRPPEYRYFEPRLVAVSKLKPAELVIDAYNAGQRHFGENYVNELVEKGNHPDVLSKCKEIQWHFIGHLQRNKVNKVLSVPNLYMIETVDTEKIATVLNTSWPKFRKSEDHKLKIMVQINTSKEEEKHGCDIEEAPNLVKCILENCKNLQFAGLMTIGAYGFDTSTGLNPDFLSLKKCKEDVCSKFNLDSKDVELSMGMSNDFEQAVELGSTNIRVGSSIFGERPKKNA